MKQQIIELLSERGLPASEAANTLGCNRRWVYNVAKELSLPTNPPITPGSPTEAKVLVALVKAGYGDDSKQAIATVAPLFNQAPTNIKRLIGRIRSS